MLVKYINKLLLSSRLTDLGSVCLSSNTGSTSKKKTSSTPTDSVFFPPKSLPIHPPPLPEPDIIISSAPEQVSPPTPPPLPQLDPGDALLITRPISEHMKCNTPEFERKTAFDKIKDNVKTKGKDLINLIYNPNEEYDPVCELDGKRNNLVQKLDGFDDLDGSAKLWLGKDYTNFIVKDFNNLDAPYIDLVDRTTTPRMPWHDIGVLVQGQAARDTARHFIQRWNATKLEKARDSTSFPYLIPKSYSIPFPYKKFDNLESFNVSCQVLRSVSSWSCGFLEPEMYEQSIHEAYIDTINRAQHYVYIENQFFITLSSSSSIVRNQVGDALFKRITRAHR